MVGLALADDNDGWEPLTVDSTSTDPPSTDESIDWGESLAASGGDESDPPQEGSNTGLLIAVSVVSGVALLTLIGLVALFILKVCLISCSKAFNS